MAFLIDAEAYFRCFKSAALKARESIFIVGWDVDSRTNLAFSEEAARGVPNELGPFLVYLAERHPGLRIRVLVWDSPLLFAPDREWAQWTHFDWFGHPNLCLALDSRHPTGASHHQKLVVIDDDIAFVGGIDLTARRLDGTEHEPRDAGRRDPDGNAYEPYHDVQIAVGGAAARLMGALARERWRCATDEQLTPPVVKAGRECWPEDLAADLGPVDVGIARTCPAWRGGQQVREIEVLFLESIACAEQSIYLEHQYFCSERVARAIVERLLSSGSPEIVLVLPREPQGWLEQITMGTKQKYLLAQVRKADQHGRFRAYTPVVGDNGDVGVKVHSKVMIVDGRLMNVGSANLNNRSLGLDTECDLTVEGYPGSATEEVITGFRNRLLAEHLDVPVDLLATEIEARASLIGAIEHLRGPGRSLLPFPDGAPDVFETVTANLEFLDPAAPAEPERIADEFTTDEHGQSSLRSGFIRFGALLAALLMLAVLWRWGPLSSLADASALEAWGRAFHSTWGATAALLAAYVAGGLLMFPITVLIVATGLFYDPIPGLVVAATGSILSAAAGYMTGRLLGRAHLQRLSRGRLDRISRRLARRGLLSMTIVRLIPIAPFTLINLAAGASHIRFRDYLLGTVIGMAPGIVAITVFAGQLWRAVRSPDAVNIAIVVGILLLVTAAAGFCWRRFGRRSHPGTSDRW